MLTGRFLILTEDIRRFQNDIWLIHDSGEQKCIFFQSQEKLIGDFHLGIWIEIEPSLAIRTLQDVIGRSEHILENLKRKWENADWKLDIRKNSRSKSPLFSCSYLHKLVFAQQLKYRSDKGSCRNGLTGLEPSRYLQCRFYILLGYLLVLCGFLCCEKPPTSAAIWTATWRPPSSTWPRPSRGRRRTRLWSSSSRPTPTRSRSPGPPSAPATPSWTWPRTCSCSCRAAGWPIWPSWPRRSPPDRGPRRIASGRDRSLRSDRVGRLPGRTESNPIEVCGRLWAGTKRRRGRLRWAWPRKTTRGRSCALLKAGLWNLEKM